jgi:peroxiredoxin
MIQQLPSTGDIAPDCILPATNGGEINLRSDAIAGNPIVLLFCPKGSSAGREMLSCFSRQQQTFAANGARLFAVIREKQEAFTSQQYNFPILLDRSEQVFGNFGASRDHPTTIVIRRNHHIAGILKGEPETQATAALSLIESLSWERKTVSMPMHPPVLLVPEALSHDDCARLINTFDTKGQTFLPPHDADGRLRAAQDYLGGTDYKMRVPEHMREDRIDHFFFEKSTVAFLVNRLNRVLPEIFKAFQYRVNKYESLRMACYQGSRGGYSYGHRDSIPPHLHRRFAMSINLNTEAFEGGELRFPEFGDQRYRPETGTAIVFSSSLLHEALHVTSGKRFVFLAFLFGDH